MFNITWPYWCFGDNFVHAEVRRGTQSLEHSEPHFIALLSLQIRSLERWRDQINQHGERIFSDVVNFTDLEPLIQVDTIVRR